MTLFGSGHEIVTSTTRPSTPVAGQIIYETDTKNVMVYNGSSWIQSVNTTLQSISTDANGRVTLPYQPRFSGTKSNYGGSINQDPWISNNAQVNVGSHYNTSTGYFTCPVTGYYLCVAHWIGNGAAYGYAGVKRNGAVIQFTHWNISDSWDSIGVNAIIYAATNDTISFYVGGGTSAGCYGGDHNGQSITLLG